MKNLTCRCLTCSTEVPDGQEFRIRRHPCPVCGDKHAGWYLYETRINPVPGVWEYLARLITTDGIVSAFMHLWLLSTPLLYIAGSLLKNDAMMLLALTEGLAFTSMVAMNKYGSPLIYYLLQSTNKRRK